MGIMTRDKMLVPLEGEKAPRYMYMCVCTHESEYALHLHRSNIQLVVAHLVVKFTHTYIPLPNAMLKK